MTVVVRYETHPESADENQRLVEAVFDELHRERPAGLRYTTLRDGATFVHVAVDDGDSPLPGMAAFGEFQRELGERLVGPPSFTHASVVGAYAGGPVKAVEYIEAFGRRDTAAMAALLAEDVVFESPRTRLVGAEAVLAAAAEFPVTKVRIIDALGDDMRAVVVYDMDTSPFGTLRAVDHLVFRDGRIVLDTAVFDTAAL